MPIITVDQVCKVYRVSRKDPGLGGALKALVRPRYIDKTAVDARSALPSSRARSWAILA